MAAEFDSSVAAMAMTAATTTTATATATATATTSVDSSDDRELRALSVFGAMALNPVGYIWCNRTTTSDVMSTVSTTRVFSVPSKGRNGRRVQLQLPGFGGVPSSAMLSAPPRKKHKALLREREQFFARLQRERLERSEMEEWAATCIQAIARGFLARPAQRGQRPPTPELAPTPVEVLKQQLAQLTAETDRQLRNDWSDVDGELAWRDNIARRAEARHNKHRRKKAQQLAAVVLQRVARLFLCQRAYKSHLARLMRELTVDSQIQLAKTMRGRLARVRVGRRLFDRAHKAAITIQQMARGVLTREHVKFLRMRMRCVEREEGSAILMQNLIRSKQARRRVDRKKKGIAATKVQRIQRGNMERQRLAQERRRRERAATAIQAHARKREACARVDALRELQALEEAREAATKIQSVLRQNIAVARVGRIKEQRRESAALLIQSAGRQKIARDKVGGARKQAAETRAATQIQAGLRGKADRKRVASLREEARKKAQAEAEQVAAVKLQSAQRGLAGRKRATAVAKEIEDARRAALAAEKAEAMRREEERKNKAAIRIQAGMRGVSARNEIEFARQERTDELARQAAAKPSKRVKRKGKAPRV